MKNISIGFEKEAKKRITEKKLEGEKALKKLLNTSESEMLGWLRLPEKYDKKEVETIKIVAREIKKNADVLIVIGTGGSYLGAKAAIDFLSGYYKKDKKIEIIFVGNNLSERFLCETKEYLKGKDFYINVISKSGNTLEPAVAFRYFRELCEKKYKKNAAKHIIATTDKEKGILKNIANKEGYRAFVVPNSIGGRFSVLTPVGLLPIAVAGFDIDKLLEGAKLVQKELIETKCNKNLAIQYAILRNIYYKEDNKDIEIFSTMKPNMKSFSEWLKQLFGESECKDGKGIFPASLSYTTDLHSMGQFMQEGKRNIFETFIDCEEENIDKTKTITIIKNKQDDDKLNYIAGKTVNELNKLAREATIKAHSSGGVPIIRIIFNLCDEETLGGLFYFFEIACGISATILGVNPFNQPGVEEYKKNIKASL